ncbi:MAG: glutamyl-tRNA reductase [Gammaproteobacteria bacterium]|nr:glutamyl-tRNA reductase [Gammaproteobacteria bacterium]
MPFYTLGINHQTAPVEIREKMAFSAEQLDAALGQLQALPEVSEAVILSTCNRTEIYCNLDAATPDALLDWLASERAPDDPEVRERFYAHEQQDMVQHLLRVACGLDSMVLGEPQILGQLKSAYEQARARGAVGPVLHRLFQYSFSVAKQVRTDTAIGANPVSVAYAAVNLARQIFGKLEKQTALLIGAGETIELAATYLHDKGLGRMIVANRSQERAHDLASRFSGYAIGLDEIPAHLGEADIVISSTAAPNVILERPTVEAAFGKRRSKPVFMVDIAVPRDIDPAVAEMNDVFLYTVDDLHGVIDENRSQREKAAADAEEIITARAALFIDQLRTLDAVPLIQGLREHGEIEQRRALEKAERMLAAGKPTEEVMQWLASTLTKRLLHAPTASLREAAADSRNDIIRAAAELFQLDDKLDRKPLDEDGDAE